MDDPNVWVSLGIKLPDLFAGFAGGIVNAARSRKLDPWAVVSSMVVGGLMANYMADTFSQFLGNKPGFAAFCIGAAGTPLAQGIIEASRSWRPFGSSNGKDKEKSNDGRPGS